MNDIYVFSLVTGEIFKTTQDELGLLYPYQIPLIDRPKKSCKQCYGRGYISINKSNGIYNMCTCLQKILLPNFDVSKVRVYLPRSA